jgi:hypothetical protein
VSYRRAPKVDANQQTIVAALRSVGAAVQSLAGAGEGVPDLLVWYRKGLYLLEVKNSDGRGLRFTPAQEKWRQRFDGASIVVMDAREALEAIGARYRG